MTTADALDSVLSEFLHEPITAAQRRTLLHIISGRCTKDEAEAEGVSFNTTHARRNQLYARLGVSGTREILSGLLALALRRLASTPAHRAAEVG